MSLTTTFTEGQHRGEFLVSEANGTQSRGTGTVISGQTLSAGAVVGKITASGKYTELDPDESDGSQVAAGVLFDNIDASGGDYAGAVLILRNAEVRDETTAPTPSLPAAIGVFGGIVWPSGISGGDKTTAIGQLATLGIIVRSA